MVRKLLHAFDVPRSIVFVHHNDVAEEVAAKLTHHKLTVADLNSELSKKDRKHAMDGIRSGAIRVLIASDLAARGLNIPDVTHIFNLDVPTMSKGLLMESTGSEDLAIAFEFRCDVKWKEMHVVGAAPDRRRCDVCERTVHLCGTLAEFHQHARLGNCVAVYEYGSFARITANSPEAPDAAADLPLSEKPFDPFAPDAVTPSAPRPPSHPLAPGPLPPLYVDLPFEVDLPTAGMPRLPENEQRAPKA